MATKALKHRRRGGYIQRHEEWLSSPAYRDLSCAARCLLEEFQRIYRPQRNGQLSIGTRRASRLLRVAEGTAGKAFHDLASHGFIKLVKGELWQQREAREWRLTFEPCNGREPTDDWRDWEPPNKMRSSK
jgi:hypothetical protein